MPEPFFLCKQYDENVVCVEVSQGFRSVTSSEFVEELCGSIQQIMNVNVILRKCHTLHCLKFSISLQNFIYFKLGQKRHDLTYLLIFSILILFECCDDPLNGATSDIRFETETSFGTRCFSGIADVIKICAKDKMSLWHEKG